MATDEVKHDIALQTKDIHNLLGAGKREEALDAMIALRSFILKRSRNGDLVEDRAYIEKAIAQLQTTCAPRPPLEEPPPEPVEVTVAPVVDLPAEAEAEPDPVAQAVAAARLMYLAMMLVVGVVTFIAGVLVGRATVPPPPPAATSSAVAVAGGTIQGTLTYYFNNNNSSRPDAGAEVYLREGEAPDVTASTDAFKTAVANAFKSAVSDAQGTFRFVGLRPGTYTLLIQSSHAKDQSPPPPALFFFKTVTVKGDESIDASHDFGTTY